VKSASREILIYFVQQELKGVLKNKGRDLDFPQIVTDTISATENKERKERKNKRNE
jgi:hypothetical protein